MTGSAFYLTCVEALARHSQTATNQEIDCMLGKTPSPQGLSGFGTGCPGLSWHPWRCLKDVYNLGLDDLKYLFQPKRFMILLVIKGTNCSELPFLPKTVFCELDGLWPLEDTKHLDSATLCHSPLVCNMCDQSGLTHFYCFTNSLGQ